MTEVGAVVELLPRIAPIPTPGDADSYRLPPEKALQVRERLCHELLSVVPLSSLFPSNVVPTHDEAWKLLKQVEFRVSSAQQRAEALLLQQQSDDGVPALPEYSKNRRGMTCGHVFRKGEPIFRCHDCSFDDTCVQCVTCFRHSIHARENHDVLFSVADEGGACCDCGDEEAWKRDLGCEFHSLHPYNEPANDTVASQGEQTLEALVAAVPDDVQQSLHEFSSLLLSFLLQTFLHAPKQAPLVMGPDVVDGVKRQPTLEHAFPDKGKARQETTDNDDEDNTLAPAPAPLFVALLWNDEKHSFNEVSDKIQEVCTTMTTRDARHFAEQVDRVGRQVVAMSDDVRRLILMARRIGVIYLLVTVQPAFDFYVEEVAGCVLDFVVDMASCSLYSGSTGDGRAIKALLTQTMLRPWHVAEWEEQPVTIRRDLFDPTKLCMLDTLLLLDTKMWKGARMSVRRLLMDLIACREAKRQVAQRVAAVYPRLIETFILHDREPEHSIYHLTVQLFSVPSIATQLVVERGLLVVLLYVLQALFANESDTRITSLVLPAPLPPRGQANPDTALLRQQKCYHIFYDIRYLLGAMDVQRDIVAHFETHLAAWLEFFALFHSIAPDIRAVHAHVEFESELWVQVFHINSHLGRIAKLLGEAFVHADNAQLCEAIAFVGKTMHTHLARLSSLDETMHPPFRMHTVQVGSTHHQVLAFQVASEPVSFHHPMHWLLAEMLKHLHMKSCREELRSLLGEEALLGLVEHPLRVTVKLAQIRCNLWVRNGFAIRSQAYHYRDSMWMRDIMYDQDLFLQQCGLMLISPDRFLATMLDRFDLIDWFSGRAWLGHATYDRDQMLFMAEEMLFLLAVLLNEISVPAHWPIEAQVRRELVHYLALGPCTYSELTKQIPERFTDHGCFDRELAQVAHFREPDGTADHGMYELRPAYLADVQPFFHHYSRNQREKAEQILSEKRAQGITLPLYPTSQLHALTDTPFASLADVFLCPLFGVVLFHALHNARTYEEPPDTLVNVVLHLLAQGIEERGTPFIECLLHEREVEIGANARSSESESKPKSESYSLLSLLLTMQADQKWKAYEAKLHYILDKAAISVPHVAEAVAKVRGPPAEPTIDDKKRQAARARQAAILNKFSAQQKSLLAELDDEFSDEDDEDEGFGTCILCQERLDAQRAFGTLMHVQESRLLRTSVPRDHASMDDVLCTPLSWAPTAGPNAERTRGTYTRREEHVTLGYPASAHQTGLVAVSCGHAMHVSCFHTYMQSTEQRHAMQVARNHPEDLSRFEYVCPLCKSLGNIILPGPGASAFSTALGATLSHDEAFHFNDMSLGEWVRHMNISILKLTPAHSKVHADHQDTSRGTGCFLPWLIDGTPQPHNPDYGAGVFADDESHMLQRYLNVMQLLADESRSARMHDMQLNAMDAIASTTEAMYLPDTLVGYTLAQLEIGQRGLPKPFHEAITPAQLQLVQTLLDALRAMAHISLNDEASVLDRMRQGLLKRLLPHWANEPAVRAPLLLRSPLGVLIEAAIIAPQDLLQITALLYYVQLVQCIFGLAQPVSQPAKPSAKGVDLDEAASIFPHARWLVTSIVGLVGYVRGNMTLGFDQLNDQELAKALCAYTFPFLRRAALLRRVVAAPKGGDVSPPSHESEYASLLTELRIPTPAMALPMQGQPNELMTMLVEGWTKHAYAHLAPLFRPLPIHPELAHRVPNLVLEHPHIYELLPLPVDLTELLQQTQERKCKRCGTLPPTFSLCLFCGDVLCEQSYCCSDPDDESRGECNQHMEQCGGRVSLHFRVGSNAVVMLYQSNGTFASSPYLNSHGEVDRYLLKARPQRLHMQRYDELRKQWLTHGIANIVTRRVESTIDQGGWITF
ncbi:E3 ubiquitin-protein ligase Ubr1 [Malassezia pachydermatis]|uniref:E3 ubiquitin-protein ligase n=1 Tax=Malassezia pachydermatis TaxID=77020 RepID=A0A0M8MSC9_9BASI|nr:ubiquitin-protein ligase e3 component [Malassezia pachydermatis]KOS12671.1 ubiquitin-protein ligase e3 component [Malassezia pachydermatis]